jgi:hypothetical protein
MLCTLCGPDARSRDNLEPDLVFWQQQLQREPSVQDILAMAQSHKLFTALPNTRRLVEIRGNRLRFPLMPPGPKQTACDEECVALLADRVGRGSCTGRGSLTLRTAVRCLLVCCAAATPSSRASQRPCTRRCTFSTLRCLTCCFLSTRRTLLSASRSRSSKVSRGLGHWPQVCLLSPLLEHQALVWLPPNQEACVGGCR